MKRAIALLRKCGGSMPEISRQTTVHSFIRSEEGGESIILNSLGQLLPISSHLKPWTVDYGP